MPPQQPAPPERGERVRQRAHGQRPAGGQVDAVDSGGQLHEVACALGERRRFGGERGSVVVERAEPLAMHRGVARVGLALHPVDGREQLPRDVAPRRDIAVQLLAAGERRFGGREERGGNRVRELLLVTERGNGGRKGSGRDEPRNPSGGRGGRAGLPCCPP
jgi:hypothetical protein